MTGLVEDGVPPVNLSGRHHFDIDVIDDEVNDNPIEQVRLTVPTTDDPSQPTLTFRTWVLGLLSCSVLAFVNQFFGYRQNQLYVSSVSAQILVLPLGKLMAATLPTKQFFVPFTKWSFSMNPGPFNLKEHVLIDQVGDIHTRLMKKNYEAVPQWWFHIILISMVALAIFACEGFGKQLQLPWWGVLMACGIALFFTLPIGIIQATTNQQPGLNVITELVIGYIYPGKPLANVAFKTYGYISMSQALMFLGDFKLGHYMKIDHWSTTLHYD